MHESFDLSGEYRSRNDSTSSLWDAESSQIIFQAIVSLQKMYMLLQVICFDSYDRRLGRGQQDKMAVIREVRLVRPGCFRGHCPFKQHMPSKQCKYAIKVLQHVMPGHVMLGTCRFILENPKVVLVKEPREVCGSGD